MKKQKAAPRPLQQSNAKQSPFNSNTGVLGTQKTMPDPRIMLISVFVTGICVWQLPPLAVIALGVLSGCGFWYGYSALTLPPRTISRLAKFIGFWLVFKVVMQYAPLLWAQKNDWLVILKGTHADFSASSPDYFWGKLSQTLLGFLERHSAELAQTGLFCIQLSSLVLLGLLLAGAYSAYNLACAFSWCLRPLHSFTKIESWKLALALALLLNYIPRIFETLDSIRQATRLRHLPTQGFAYWRMAIPRFFGILAEQTWSQAVAIASRKLDSSAPWAMLAPLPLGQALFCGVYTVALLMSLLSPFLT